MPAKNDTTSKRCKECRAVKAIDDFGLNARYKDGRQARCKPCHEARRPKAAVRPVGYVLPETKACTKCGAVKPLADFSPNRMILDGRQSYCRDCDRARYKAFAATAEGKAKIAKWELKSKIKSRYGITRDDYDRILAEQGGVCAICGKPPHGRNRNHHHLHVDHEHSTGRVRGLLCNRCNISIGAFGDSVEAMMKAVEYLRRSQPSPLKAHS